MHKINLIILLLLAPSFSNAMAKYPNIAQRESDSSSEISKGLKLHQRTEQYARLVINPAQIKSTLKITCPSIDTESYYSELVDGHSVSCTYFHSGQYAGQTWSEIIILDESLYLKFSIPQKNFFILKEFYEKQKKS